MGTSHRLGLVDDKEIGDLIQKKKKDIKQQSQALRLTTNPTLLRRFLIGLGIFKDPVVKIKTDPDEYDLSHIIEHESKSYEELSQFYRYKQQEISHILALNFYSKEAKLLEDLLGFGAYTYGPEPNAVRTSFKVRQSYGELNITHISSKNILLRGKKMIEILERLDINKHLDLIKKISTSLKESHVADHVKELESIKKAMIEAIRLAMSKKKGIVLISSL